MIKKKINKFLYILDHTFVKKYCVSYGVKYKTTKYDYLPIINTTKLNLEELSNSKFLIYLKCVKATKSNVSGFFGYFIGQHILINSKQSKQIKIPNTADIIVTDDNEYKKIIHKYNLCDMDDLVFIRYDKVIPFNSIVSPLKYKKICGENNIQFEKIPSRLNCLNIMIKNLQVVMEMKLIVKHEEKLKETKKVLKKKNKKKMIIKNNV